MSQRWRRENWIILSSMGAPQSLISFDAVIRKSVIMRGAGFPDVGFDDETVFGCVFVAGFQSRFDLDPLVIAASEFHWHGFKQFADANEYDIPVPEGLDRTHFHRDGHFGLIDDDFAMNENPGTPFAFWIRQDCARQHRLRILRAEGRYLADLSFGVFHSGAPLVHNSLAFAQDREILPVQGKICPHGR